MNKDVPSPEHVRPNAAPAAHDVGGGQGQHQASPVTHC
jgi:hypothetical protein